MSGITDKLAAGLDSVQRGDLFFSQRRTLQMKAFRGEIASFTESDDQWVSARAVDDSRMGTAFTEKFDSDSLREAAARARENARFAGQDPGNDLFGKEETGEYDGRKGRLDTRSIDEKKDM